MMDNIDLLKKIIFESDNIVFFGGAGVSVPSNIPDFRSNTGIYSKPYKYSPEEILSHTYFINHPEDFFDFYKNNMVFVNALPNRAHLALTKLEKSNKLKAIITQNIDGLHQKAGNRNVIELHGSVVRNYCMKCHRYYNVNEVLKFEGVPKCSCGGIIKPDVVLYEESLNDKDITDAVNYIRKAQTLIVAGTSLVVNPAASLIRYFNGQDLILINKTKTPYDHYANLIINESVDEVLDKVTIDL